MADEQQFNIGDKVTFKGEGRDDLSLGTVSGFPADEAGTVLVQAGGIEHTLKPGDLTLA